MSYYKTSRNYEELLFQLKNGHSIIGKAGEKQIFVIFSHEKGITRCDIIGGGIFFVIMPNDVVHTGINEVDYFEQICEIKTIITSSSFFSYKDEDEVIVIKSPKSLSNNTRKALKS